MGYIKKMVMHGFKSFARRTEIVFDKGVNVILGPNGSGKSNVADALCFVLGRLSIKSMRAAKAKNLLFMGSKYIKPAREAYVELVFDNSDRSFSIDADEIVLKRAVRFNGQGVYKINDQTKTRIEVIEMLAQAGIDPYGFNMILQGQIQSIVKMHPEERRKIIEEVAGISIYESRKEKSLKELEKTDEKLKEITAILRERGAYLKNLDRERTQALRFKELEGMARKCKASILNRRIHEKSKEVESIEKSINEKSLDKDKKRNECQKLQEEINTKSEQINLINRSIQKASGIEQENLHNQISTLRVEIEGLKVRKENFENRKAELERRISEMNKQIPDLKNEISKLKEESPLVARKSNELKKKKEELSILEEERKKMFSIKTELSSLRERIKDKEKQISKLGFSSDSFIKQMDEYSDGLAYSGEKDCASAIISIRQRIAENKKILLGNLNEKIVLEKQISVAQSESERARKIKEDVEKIDVCPLCRSKMTSEHIAHVSGESDKVVVDSNKFIEISKEKIISFNEEYKKIESFIHEQEKMLSSAEIELMRHKSIKEKTEQIKKMHEDEQILKEESSLLESRMKSLENRTNDSSKIEERYDKILLEIEEISSRTSEDLDTSLLYKERELDEVQNVIKHATKDVKDIEEQISSVKEALQMKISLFGERERQEKEFQERFKKMFSERENVQREIQIKSMEFSEVQSMVRAVEEQVNYLKIGKAKVDAEKEALQMESVDFDGAEIISGSITFLEEKLKKAQESLMQIGSINMRALEVFESVKKDYDEVEEKVKTLEKEKLDILNIIAEIDHKKKKSFMKTYHAMNQLFSENFAKLSSKGTAYLEIENKEDMFAGGVNIIVRMAKGKYFDVTSLSGGEQTLVALSLLFAIQEYKPYYFYIFDEIDAALDKRNSEKLAALLSQYMKAGQYIVITHNDAIILNANYLYGISMHDGVSKILSLNLSDGKEIKSESGSTGAILENSGQVISEAVSPEVKEEIR